MTKTQRACAIAAAIVSVTVTVHAQQAEVTLSAAQQQHIAKAIAALKYPQERALAKAWSPAKQAAEILCKPEALRVLKKKDPSIDRVFLGDNTPGSLHLVSDRLLEGKGMARNTSGWNDMAFTCTLDPATGTALKVEMTGLKPEQE